MSHPFDLPIIGKKKFAANEVSKEQLLEYWNGVRKQTGLKVQEGTKFDGLKKENDIFEVQTSRGAVKVKKVILAMGVRGSPRKLGVPGEDSAKVTYNLIDPEQYQNKNIIVVGGGNAGVESAQMLGNPKYKNKVRLLVRGAIFDRCNEENIKRITAMKDLGQVEILFNTSVTEIQKDKAVILSNAKSQTVPNDFCRFVPAAKKKYATTS
jgi:thioredoxin reductase